MYVERLLTAMLLIALAPAQALGEEIRSGWGGFLSQGWIVTDHNRFYGSSDDGGGSLDYRELGLNGWVEPGQGLRLAGQLLSRKAGEVSDGDPEVDFLFAQWQGLDRMSRQAGLRLGRIKNPIGLYNDTRDVAMTRPGVLLPQALYFDKVRELQISIDGAGAYYNSQRSGGIWSLELVHGRLNTGNNTEELFLGRAWAGAFDEPEGSVARLMIEPGNWRLGWTELDFNLPFEPAAEDKALASLLGRTMTAGRFTSRISIGSVQYNQERWSLTAEVMRANNRWRDLGSIFVRDRARLEAGYLQFDYRLSPEWQFFLRWEELYFNDRDRGGRAFEAAGAGKASTQFARDRVLGARWQPHPRWELRAEWHHIDGTAWLSKNENDPARLEQRWQMLLLQAAWRF